MTSLIKNLFWTVGIPPDIYFSYYRPSNKTNVGWWWGVFGFCYNRFAVGDLENVVRCLFQSVYTYRLVICVTIFKNKNVWLYFVVQSSKCWFGRGKPCKEVGEWRQLHTVLGPCSSFHVRHPVKETGLFNGLYMQMETNAPSDSWIYFIHPANIDPALKFYDEKHYELLNTNNDVKIRFYQALNRFLWYISN